MVSQTYFYTNLIILALTSHNIRIEGKNFGGKGATRKQARPPADETKNRRKAQSSPTTRLTTIIMTIDEKKQYEESNIAVVTAVPEPGMITAVGVKEDGIPAAAGPPVPPGHARFYCEKCRSVSTV